MKRIFPLIFFVMLMVSCQVPRSAGTSTEESEIKPSKNEEGEWDIDVIDDRYDYFLHAIAKPMNMYSESYLKSKNSMLVSEWNSLYYSGRYRNIIESSIDYDRQENYGMKFEYKLYQVFAYVQWRYGLKLSALSGAEIR